MTRREALSLSALALPGLSSTASAQFRAIVPQGVKPQKRGPASGLPFNAKFTNVAKAAGLTAPVIFGDEGHADYILDSLGCGVAFIDYDNDGWQDLYVANDAGPNYLYRNRHDGTFEEVGLLSGAALSGDGQEQGSMGVDFGDFDHDGRLDLFVTNFTDQPSTLYSNQGTQGFRDVSWNARVAELTYPLVGWGTAFVDMDKDGWVDLFVANGHVYPQIDSAKGEAPYRQPLLLFQNNRDRTFRDATPASGLNTGPAESRRGAAFGDINNDGNVDVLILNVGGPPTLLLNQTQTANHAALFRLIGTTSNKAATGARVTVTAEGLVQFQEVRSGASYLSQNDMRLHFGLGPQAIMKTVEVYWPSGRKEVYQNLGADRVYTIVEGEGIKQNMSFDLRSKTEGAVAGKTSK